MQLSDLVQKLNKFRVSFKILPVLGKKFQESISPVLVIDNLVNFQVKYNRINDTNTLIFIKLFKVHQGETSYTLNFTSEELGIVGKDFICDDSWRLIYDNFEDRVLFNVSIVIRKICSFAPLHGDTELTDFELRGEDGSVRVHRAVLAACSPVLRKIVGGDFVEREGQASIPGTAQTLQHLKDYIYLHKLPDTGLKEMLLLAACYMISDLEELCVYKLACDLTASNAYDLLEFAINQKMYKLLLAILSKIQSGTIAVNDIRNHLPLLNEC